MRAKENDRIYKLTCNVRVGTEQGISNRGQAACAMFVVAKADESLW